MKSPARKVPDLLKNWDDVAKKIQLQRRVTVFLDFDGTLVAIAPRPDQVRLAPVARKILGQLARHPLATLVVVSGRRRAELLEHIGIPGIHYFGLYGWERNAKSALPASVRAALSHARTAIEPLLVAYPGLWIENKHNSLSVHLLHLPAGLHSRVRGEIRVHLKRFQKSLRAVENIRDVEILPRSIPGKGIAVSQFLAQPAHRKSFPFYFGDDFSDESGFAAVKSGASVHVGHPRPTRAQYHLRNPAEVAKALARLYALLSQS
ncbi:MAG: trehalose-phosphatase [Candidatus Acidiferrum sp.]|jgi:trehalose 6-phosphate phosphatase